VHVTLDGIFFLEVMLGPVVEPVELDDCLAESEGHDGLAVSARDVQIVGFGYLPCEYTWKVEVLADRVERDDDLLFNIFEGFELSAFLATEFFLDELSLESESVSHFLLDALINLPVFHLLVRDFSINH